MFKHYKPIVTKGCNFSNRTSQTGHYKSLLTKSNCMLVFRLVDEVSIIKIISNWTEMPVALYRIIRITQRLYQSHVTAGVYWRAFIRVNLSNVNTVLKKATLKTNLSPKYGPKSILSNSVMTKCKYISWVIQFILLFCDQRPIVPVSALWRTSADKVTFTDKEHDQSSSHTNEYLLLLSKHHTCWGIQLSHDLSI